MWIRCRHELQQGDSKVEDGVVFGFYDGVALGPQMEVGAGMRNRLSLVLRNDLTELERLAQSVSAWCQANSISSETEFQVNLALNEIVSNVIEYGWKDQGEHRICVGAWRLQNELRVEIVDDATPFNPLEAPEPDVEQPLEERTVGGLGIHLVRQIMDALEYRRRDGKNCLVMKKKLNAASSAL